MKKILIIFFIINIYIGQFLYSQERKKDILSLNEEIINLYEKARIQTIILTFFYTKVDRIDDFETIFELKDFTKKFKNAKKIYKKIYCIDPEDSNERTFDVFKNDYFSNIGRNINRDNKGHPILDLAYYQRIIKDKYCDLEPFYFLANILNKINLELLKINEQFNIDSNLKKFVLIAYNLFIIAMHQFPICIRKEEIFFYSEILDRLNNRGFKNLDRDYLIKVAFFLLDKLDEILKKSWNLVLSLPEADNKLKLIEKVFINNEFFPYFSVNNFYICFEKLRCIEISKEKYPEDTSENFSKYKKFKKVLIEEIPVVEFEELLSIKKQPLYEEIIYEGIAYEDLFEELTFLYNI